MKKGDLVKITDGSYAVRVDQFENYSHIGQSKDIFEIIKTGEHEHLVHKYGGIRHDVFIQNTVNKKIYLHSLCYLQLLSNKFKLTTEDGQTIFISKESLKELKKL